MGKGEEQKTFHIQEACFIAISDVFAALMRNKSLGSEEKDTCKFPEDDVGAWEVLLYWTFRGALMKMLDERKNDEAADRLLLVQSWILGDRYNVSRFQDEVMLELL